MVIMMMMLVIMMLPHQLISFVKSSPWPQKQENTVANKGVPMEVFFCLPCKILRAPQKCQYARELFYVLWLYHPEITCKPKNTRNTPVKNT